MLKANDKSSQIRGVSEGTVQRSPVREPSLGADFDRTIAVLAAKKGKKPGKYEKLGYKPPKKKPAKKK